MHRSFLIVSLVAVAAVVIPTSSYADNETEVGLFGGFHWYDANNALGDVARQGVPEDAFILGARGSWGFMPWFAFEGELGVLFTEGSDTGGNLTVLDARIQALGYFMTGRLRPFGLAGVGLQTGIPASGDTDVDGSIHLGIGAKYDITKNIGARIGGRIILGADNNNQVGKDYEVLAGVYWRFGTKGSKPMPVKPKNEDPDGDGIAGAADACPNEKEDVDGFEDEDGCPDGEPDGDGDGVPDDKDQCKDKAETVNGIDDDDGCPETDDDGDKVLGSQDKCPDKPEDLDGFQDGDGCPDLDNDGDGVPDDKDKCDGQLETMNNYQDDDGCPDTIPKAVQQFTGAIAGIKFQVASATIKTSSYRVLDEAVGVLTKYPSLRLEIGGHTDSSGSDEENLALSQKRAEAVRQYLIGKGIADSRLEAKGYGEVAPIADNKTPMGRSKNRRVEFKRLK